MKPLIGFSSYFVDANEQKMGVPAQDLIMTTLDYPRNIQRVGGIPVAIPVIEGEDYIESLLERLDGLVLTGGGDVDPGYYQQSYKIGLGTIEPIRDAFEMKLIQQAMAKKIPILGICRGLQILNIYFGGTLIQDIPKYYKTEIAHGGYMGPKWNIAHKVILQKDNAFYDYIQKEALGVNSFHHQMIDSLGSGLKAVAISEDGIIEAFIGTGEPFVMGVQWHPEMMSEVHGEQQKIFEFFMEAVHKNKASFHKNDDYVK